MNGSAMDGWMRLTGWLTHEEKKRTTYELSFLQLGGRKDGKWMICWYTWSRRSCTKECRLEEFNPHTT